MGGRNSRISLAVDCLVTPANSDAVPAAFSHFLSSLSPVIVEGNWNTNSYLSSASSCQLMHVARLLGALKEMSVYDGLFIRDCLNAGGAADPGN